MPDSMDILPSLKRQRLECAPADSDSDCILVDAPECNAGRPNTFVQVVGIDDDILVAGETTGTVVLRDLPHCRPDCVMRLFKQQVAYCNGTFCPQCFCYVCDVRASQCKYWGTGARPRDHCQAHNSSAYWIALRKAARKGKTPLLQQEYESTNSNLITHWKNNKYNKKGPALNAQPRTLDQLWARAGFTRAPRGSQPPPQAAAAAQRSTSSSSDSGGSIAVLDSPAAAAAATLAAADTATTGHQPVQVKVEKVDEVESPLVLKPMTTAAVCRRDSLQYDQQQQQTQEEEQWRQQRQKETEEQLRQQQLHGEVRAAPQADQQQQQQVAAEPPSSQQHTALDDITNTQSSTLLSVTAPTDKEATAGAGGIKTAVAAAAAGKPVLAAGQHEAATAADAAAAAAANDDDDVLQQTDQRAASTTDPQAVTTVPPVPGALLAAAQAAAVTVLFAAPPVELQQQH